MKAVILAGGGGTRLWPLSIPERPKQFQKIVSEKTMIEDTIDRLDFLDIKNIYIAINKDQLSLLKNIVPHFPEENIIVEPALRDTSSCIGFAATIIEKNFPGEVMAVCYADHLIQNKKEFQNKLELAAKIAKEEKTLNIVEVSATEANTNYGYVKLGTLDKKINGTEIFNLDSFVEKPDKETAIKFLKAGNYLWNTGIYVWRTDVLLNHYKNLQIEIYEKFMKIKEALNSPKEKQTIDEIYPHLEKISIDYAIMEKVDPKEVRIIKADLNWSDIGNWEAIWQELDKNEKGNIIRGNTKTKDCKNCLIYGETKRKIAVIGLENIVIIDTKDGLLISTKEDSKKVKEIL